MTDYKIISANFVASFVSLKPLQALKLPEIAFVGRSNVGKSSLLNALCHQKTLAKTSNTPGRTQMINFFCVRFTNDNQEDLAHFVDLPGFGYAKVPRAIQKKWGALIEPYLTTRRNLKLIILLIDCRRDPQEEELYLAELADTCELLVCLTKTDKLSGNELTKRKKLISEKLNITQSQLILTSSGANKKRGINELTNKIALTLFS